MPDPATELAVTGGSGGAAPIRPAIRGHRNGARQARLLRRLMLDALREQRADAGTVLGWLRQRATDPNIPLREQRLCAEAFLKHLREMAGAGDDAAVDHAARVLVIAPDDLRRLLGGPSGPDDLIAALRVHAAPAPSQHLNGASGDHP